MKYVLTTVSNHLPNDSMIYDSKEQAMDVMDKEYKDELRAYEDDSNLVIETNSSRLFNDRMQDPYRRIKTIDIKTGEVNVYEWFVSTLVPNGLNDQDNIFGGNTMNTTNTTTATNIINPDYMAIRSFNDEQEHFNWLRNFDVFEVTEEGVITCKASEEALNLLETQSLAVALLWEDALDAILIGEDGCLNNFDMYTPIFVARFNCEYLVPYSTAEKFKNGETVTLYPQKEFTEEELEEGLNWAENN